MIMYSKKLFAIKNNIDELSHTVLMDKDFDANRSNR